MKFILLIIFLVTTTPLQPSLASDSLGRYQKLSRRLNELCNSQVPVQDLIRAIRKAGGLRSSKTPNFVKTNAINFPQRVRMRILKDGNWDLMTEEPTDNMVFKVEHYAPSSDYQFFAFANAKLIDPGAVKKDDRPTMVVFTPHKVIVIAAEYKHYYLLDRPDFEFAKIKYRNQTD